MKTLFVAWQDPKSREWYPVGRLTHDGRYRFVYTAGARVSPDFLPFGRMTDLYATYESESLFPLFTNRLLPKSRPEYADYLRWLDVNEDDPLSPLAILARSGGLRSTDSLEIFPEPERTPDGYYEVTFVVHGLRYLPKSAIDHIEQLKPGVRLYAMLDVQNPFHSLALALRTDLPPVFIGYCPRYLCKDFQKVLEFSKPENAKVLVRKVNADAPPQYRVLCKFSAPWPTQFDPCKGSRYRPLAQSDRLTAAPAGLRVVNSSGLYAGSNGV